MFARFISQYYYSYSHFSVGLWDKRNIIYDYGNYLSFFCYTRNCYYRAVKNKIIKKNDPLLIDYSFGIFKINYSNYRVCGAAT